MREEISRRRFIGKTAGGIAGTLAYARLRGEEAKERYRIGVCDWMILKRQKLGAFQLTKEIGADGVEVDMGSLGERETFDYWD
jgi:L-ribulose-5-phosphate 3-epimerase